MAKTKTSVSGKQNKKIVVVKGHTKSDGTKVKPHRRSTPRWWYQSLKLSLKYKNEKNITIIGGVKNGEN